MVYAANGATVVDGVVYGARFRHGERGPEAAAHRAWFRAAGFPRVVVPVFVNEGEGDLLVAGDVILAGSGFRTDPCAHAEAARVLGRDVVPLELVDSRFSARQKAYSQMRGDREVYTPQAVVNGSMHVIGSDRASIENAIGSTAKADGVRSIPVTMTQSGTQLTVSVAAANKGPAANGGTPCSWGLWLGVGTRSLWTVRKTGGRSLWPW